MVTFLDMDAIAHGDRYGPFSGGEEGLGVRPGLYYICLYWKLQGLRDRIEW